MRRIDKLQYIINEIYDISELDDDFSGYSDDVEEVDSLEEYYYSLLDEYGLVSVDEVTDSDEIAHSLEFEDGTVLTFSIFTDEETDLPTLEIMADDEVFSTYLETETIDFESFDPSEMPEEFILSIVQKYVDSSVKFESNVTKSVRNGKVVVRRKKRVRLSPKQKAALRKAQRASQKRSSADRKRSARKAAKSRKIGQRKGLYK